GANGAGTFIRAILGAGSATGSSAVSGVAPIFLAVGSARGRGFAVAQGFSDALSVGTATGTSQAAGVSSIVQTRGAATGSSAVAGVSSVKAAVGTVAGAANVAPHLIAIAGAVGTAIGQAIVVGPMLRSQIGVDENGVPYPHLLPPNATKWEKSLSA